MGDIFAYCMSCVYPALGDIELPKFKISISERSKPDQKYNAMRFIKRA